MPTPPEAPEAREAAEAAEAAAPEASAAVRAAPPGPPEVLDRREGPYGEVVLRRHGDLLQIIANGCFLMDTSDGRSERLLVDHALAALDGRARPTLLVGGLGVGFSLAHAAAQHRWGRITVVEREPAVIDWHTGPGAPFAHLTARPLADPRTRVVRADLIAHLRDADGRYDALCLDIDNGPDWTVTDDNAGLYSPRGLAACLARLTPGGVLAVWSARPSPGFEERLRRTGFQKVRTEQIPVPRGVPDVVHLAVRAG
ncbi:spermidine synthase [Streptomyces sp. NPDC050560]|uniref:spermidine synthase n=1 Tax=Streptomyces sp. NPDC050560 TaxID=3365630 RepID=UPI00378C30E6